MHPPTNQIKSLLDSTLARIKSLVEQHMMDVALDWQTQFPKRQVQFLSLPMPGYLIDGKWIIVPQKYAHVRQPQTGGSDTWGYTSGEQHRHLILMPLFDAMEWYSTMVDECGHIDHIDFTLEPLK